MRDKSQFYQPVQIWEAQLQPLHQSAENIDYDRLCVEAEQQFFRQFYGSGKRGAPDFKALEVYSSRGLAAVRLLRGRQAI